MGLGRLGLICSCFFLFGSVASAATFMFSGVFTQDDNQAYFMMTLNSPQAVTIQTTSYATGGFAPVLSIFGDPSFGTGDPSLLGTNSGGSPCGVRTANSTTGLCLDALLGYDSNLGTNQLGTLSAGDYLVVITEQDNVPNGPDLAAGFLSDGQGNFTAVPGVNPGPFVDPSDPSITDTGVWTIQFLNADDVTEVPELSTSVLMFAGLGVIAVVRRRRAA